MFNGERRTMVVVPGVGGAEARRFVGAESRWVDVRRGERYGEAEWRRDGRTGGHTRQNYQSFFTIFRTP